MKISDRIQHAWNAFFNKDPPQKSSVFYGGTSYRPDRHRLTKGQQRTIISSVYTRIAMDVAAIDILHTRLDEEGRYVETVHSGLNSCLTVSANTDQTGRAFIQDVVMSLLDEGCIAIVPTDTNISITNSNSFDILTMRTGKIVDWYPKHIRVNVYNESTGQREDITLPKSSVAIVENPLYAVMNEHNSTLQRLVRKLNLLDAIDEQSGAGKLDMIIQLPYIVKTAARKEQAEARRKELEMQLSESKYGIAYTDGTQKITQINRPLENNLMSQIEYLTKTLYSQLGITEEVFAGTANEDIMLNYYNRTIEPILSAICDEMKRKFLTKTARTQKQSISFFRNPFRLATVEKIASIADVFNRNEILSSNEIRQLVGYKPSGDPNADELRNSNMPHPDEESGYETEETTDMEYTQEAPEETVQESIQEESPTEQYTEEPSQQYSNQNESNYSTVSDPQESYSPYYESQTMPMAQQPQIANGPQDIMNSPYLVDPATGLYVPNPYYQGGMLS